MTVPNSGNPASDNQVSCDAVATEPTRQIPAASNLALKGLMLLACVCSCAAMATGFWLGSTRMGSSSIENSKIATNELPQLMAASAASSDSMAVATGPISNDAEGIFFLDFITGDLQCLVYYPRSGAFGARYFGNVLPQLGAAGKNSKYLLVTGQAVTTATSGGPRPGASLVYVTDVNTGMFAAYAVPWDRSAESSNRMQSGPLVYVGGGPIRNYQLRDVKQNQPAAIVDPNQKQP